MHLSDLKSCGFPPEKGNNRVFISLNRVTFDTFYSPPLSQMDNVWEGPAVWLSSPVNCLLGWLVGSSFRCPVIETSCF